MAETSTSPELVLSHLDSLPTLPAVVIRLLQITADDESGTGNVIKLLRGDQSLTAKILSLAGSAALGVRGPVKTLEKAVPLLGLVAIRNIVLANSVFECFGKPSAKTGTGAFDRPEFWKHSLAVACGVRRLALIRTAGDQTRRTRRSDATVGRELAVDPEDAYVAGLLHDIGKVALDTVFPKAYDRIAAQANHSRGDIADHERAILGADHTVAGRRLAERWRLPRDLQDAIWLHHLAADALPSSVANPRLIGLVQLADTIAREQRVGYSGNHTFYELSPRLAERMGYTPEQIAAAVQHLAADVAEHAARLGLDAETADGVHLKAMTRANAELGRLNTELLLSNRRLAAGARCFDAISRFERELGDWSDPSAVVAALANAAATVLQRPRVIAFGVRDNGSVIDVSWVGATPEECGQFTQAVPAELASWLGEAPRQIDALIVQAPQVLRALLVPALGPGQRGTPWLLPVFRPGELVGGIVHLSEADERARLADEADELRSFLASVGLALGRANAQAAARRLSEDLAQTNRRLQQMQVELLRSRTLSMIAEMAAGAGHELNSPLTVISGRAQMLASTLEDPEARRVLKMISDKAHECSGIVTELMDFARPPPPRLAPVEPRELLAAVRAAWLERTDMPPSRIRLETGPAALRQRRRTAPRRSWRWPTAIRSAPLSTNWWLTRPMRSPTVRATSCSAANRHSRKTRWKCSCRIPAAA